MNGKPRAYPALLRSVQYAELALMPSTKRTGKMVDKAILVCLAMNASDVGAGARPGNAALCQASGVGHSQLGIHLDGLIAANMIERTYRGDGHGNASAYRILYNHPVFPDRSPNGKEVFVKDDGDKPSEPNPDGLDSAQSQPSGLRANLGPNHPVSSGNHPVCEGNHPVSMPDTILIPSQEQPNHPSKPKTLDGWDVFVQNLPTMMKQELHTLGTRKDELKALVDRWGASLMLATVQVWMDERRPYPVDGIKRNKWLAFLDEYQDYINDAYKRTPEGRLAEEAQAEARVRAAEEAAAIIDRKIWAEVERRKREEPAEQTFEETQRMLRELSK